MTTYGTLTNAKGKNKRARVAMIGGKGDKPAGVGKCERTAFLLASELLHLTDKPDKPAGVVLPINAHRS
jgi:hypothetical protein